MEKNITSGLFKMESNESEKYLITLREHIAEFLDNISDIGTALNKKSNNLLCEIGNISHTDINKLENIGIRMVKLLNILNINVLDITNLLEKDLSDLNENRPEKLFTDLCSKMLEYKKSFAMDSISNNGVSSKTSVFVDKDIQTDCSNDVPGICDIKSVCENSEVKSEVETDTVTNVPHVVNNLFATLDSKKAMNLGLIRTDTQDTDDCWIDSINRNTTALELWNRKHQGEKVNVTDEYLDRLKEEQDEDNEWDRKTEDLNYNFDRQLSSGDDTFIDGKSPKAEEASDEQTIEIQIEDNPLCGSQNKESLGIDEHESANTNDATHQLPNNSEKTSSEPTRLNSEDLQKSTSDIGNECNNKGTSDISDALQMMKQRLAPKEIDECNQDIPCCSTKIPSEQIITNNCKFNDDIDSKRSNIKDVEQTETNKSVTGSLSSLNENMSTALITLTDRLEVATAVDNGSKETELCADKSVESSLSDGKLSENKGSYQEQTEINKLNSDSLDSSESDHLQTVTSVAHENTNTDFQDVKLTEDSNQRSKCLNKQTGEYDSDKISSEATYSQETVKLCNSPRNNEADLDKDESKCTDNLEHFCSEKSKNTDSDETDIDETTLSISQLLTQIENHSSDEEVEHLLCEKGNLSVQKNIDKDTNKLPTSEPLLLQTSEASEKSNVSDSDETVIDEDTNKLFTPESLQTANQVAPVDKLEHLSSEKSNVSDSDETVVDELGHPYSEKNDVSDSDETVIYESTKTLLASESVQTVNQVEPVEKLEHLSSGKSNVSDSEKKIIDEDANELLASECPQTVNQLEPIDELEHPSSEKSNVSDSDENIIDGDANELLASECPQTVNQLEPVNELGHLSSEKSNVSDSDENIIDEDANELLTSECPQTVNQLEPLNELGHPSSDKSNVSDSDENIIDEDANELLTSECSQIANQLKPVEELGHPSSEKSNVPDSDENIIDEDANELLASECPLTVNQLEPVDELRHSSSENTNLSNSDKKIIDEDANELLASECPQTMNQLEPIDELGHPSSEKSNVLDSDENIIDEDANELLMSECSQTVNEVEPAVGLGHHSSERSESNENEIGIDDELLVTKLPSQVASFDKSNRPDSDDTDIDEESYKLPISEIFPDIHKGNSLPNSINSIDNEENISEQNTGTSKNISNFDSNENLSKNNIFDREKADKSDSLFSEISKQSFEHSENLSGNEKSDNDEIDPNRPNPECSVITEIVTENYCTLMKKTANIEEDSSSESSNKSFVFSHLKNIEIEGDTENDNVNSPVKLTNTEEGNSSDSSNKSFVFNIGTGQNLIPHIGEQLNDVEVDQHLAPSNQNIDQCPPNSSQKAEAGAIGETIEILSDSDDEDAVQLDVTMEEIISGGSTIENINEQKDIKEEEIIIKETVNDPEPIIVNDNDEESNSEKDIIPTTQQIIGDELLELLREVEVPSMAPLSDSTRNIQKSNSKKDMQDADEIFKMLQDESESDLSESEISVDISCSDTELLENTCNSKGLLDAKYETPVQSDKENLQMFDIKECYVHLEKLQLEADDVVKVNKNLVDSIDRLCDISNILCKRKYGDPQKLPQTKKVKKTNLSNKGTSDSDILSDYSHSDTDSVQHDKPTFSTNFMPHVEDKFNDLLAHNICNVFKNNSSSESTDVDSDDSNKSSKKKKGDKGKIVSDARNKARVLSKEELKRKAWKNDPLLRGKLTTSDEDSSDSEKSFKKRNALRTRYEHDTDFNIVTEENDSDSDCSHINNQNKIQLEDKLISPIKRNIPISDSSSDTDSDIEIIPSKQPKTPQKDSELGNEFGPSSSQKGRRNIRALMANESLTEATQRANKEEQERIERLEDRLRIKESLSQSFSQIIEEDTLILDVDELTGEPLVKVHPKLNQRLKPHQKSGIQFMWDSCYESLERLKVDEGSGCILAHCMGLGKTFQVITLLHTLFSYEETNTKHVLVVCPTSTVNNWKKEVKIAFKHFPDEKLNVISIVDKKEVSQKYSIVKKWSLLKKCVLVMGYECFETLTNEMKLDKIGWHLKQRMLDALIEPGPDLVICDEGHLLRNKKALKTLALNRIRTKRRIVLTGTPLQNNLLEYYYMVNFVKPNLLGTMKEYKTNFVNPITNGQYEDSTAGDIKLMMKRTHVLHKLLKKTIQRVEDTELKIYLPKIVDHAIFIQLHQVQVELYNKFSKLVAKNSSNTNKKGFLSDFSIFQYICTHPQLLAVMENLRNKKIKERDLIINEQEDNPICNIEGWWKSVVPPDAAERIEYGNKLMVLKSIIEECEEIGDKVLVFSQSLGEMNLIEHFLEKEGTSSCRSWKKKIDYCRMDGTVPPALRSTICDLFNDKDNKKLRLLLMSTKVGGLGLNLTAANRVIIMTVNWNPSYDIQSVFRVYRFGQEKEVYVYRLIALDSMEEKVYQRTVTKLAIAHRVVDKHQITRHYKSMDLQELYSCKPDADTERPICNVPEDKVLAKLILKLPYIFKHHEHQALLANRPEDNLNEQELNAAWDEFKRIKDAPQVAPPPLQHVQPQTSLLPPVTLPSGPTYSMAYDLTRPTVSINNGQKIGGQADDAAALSHYFIPSGTNSDLKKKIRTISNNSNIVNQHPKNPPGSVVPLGSRGGPSTIPVHNTAKTVSKDPLYIPLSEMNKTGKSYSEMLTALSHKQFTVPKLPSNSTIVLQESSDKGSQKENNNRRRSVDTSKTESVIILDDETNKNAKSNLSEISRIRHDNITGVKRKRNNDNSKQIILKKMREGFNKPPNHLTSINIDDDDDVTEIPDTSSESGSLSNELITNLGRSGITIHKVIKDSRNNGAIITLD